MRPGSIGSYKVAVSVSNSGRNDNQCHVCPIWIFRVRGSVCPNDCMQPGTCKNPWLACILAKNPASRPASQRDRGSGSESRIASQVELLHATLPALLATNRAMVRLAILELNHRTGTIFALIESPSDKHQRHARRYSTNVSRIHTAIRQKPAAYTHRQSTNASGTRTAV